MRLDRFAVAPFVALAFLCGCGGGAAPAPPALANVVAPSSEASGAPAAPVSNTIRWSTASEVDNFGFDVYRAESEEGPFSRLTSTPVPGAGTSDEPHAYQYVDVTIEAGKPYFYYVESLSLAGERERFTPVIRAPAKGVPAAATPGVP